MDLSFKSGPLENPCPLIKYDPKKFSRILIYLLMQAYKDDEDYADIDDLDEKLNSYKRMFYSPHIV